VGNFRRFFFSLIYSSNLISLPDIHLHLINLHQKAMADGDEFSSYESICAKFIAKARFLCTFQPFYARSQLSRHTTEERVALRSSKAFAQMGPLKEDSFEAE
jgi:hypothetical protein